MVQKKEKKKNSNKKTARLAGVAYLTMFIAGIFAEFFVRQSILVPGNAAETANNIMTSERLFRFGSVSDLVMMTSFIVLALSLYKLLKEVNTNHARFMVACVLASTPIMCINMLNQFAALLVLNGADYLNAFEAHQLQALAMLFLNLHKHGFYIAQIFNSLWLLPLGLLVVKSGYFPKILGILLIVGCFGLLIEFFQVFLFPGYEVITYPGLAVDTIAELSFCLWLLIKGVKDQKPATRKAG